MSGNDSDNERHKQYSNTASIDSEPSQKREEAQPPCPGPEPSLPLYLVLKACPDLRDYAPAGIGHWHELVGTADFVRPMLGISPDAWAGARAAMGDAVAAIALACILQRASDIRNPGGYLRALTDKAGSGAFSPGPMVMALLRAENSKVL